MENTAFGSGGAGYVTPQLVNPSPPSPPPPRKSRAGWLVLLLLLGGVFLAVLGLASSMGNLAGGQDPSLQEKYHSLARGGKEKIAIIRVDGPILEGEGFIKRQIDRVREDDGVKAVVLRVDSPGGTVTGSDYLYHHLRKLVEEKEIPLVVSMGGLCASGGYYIAMAVGDTPDAVFAEPTTWTGSIGVIIPHYSVAGLLAKWEVKEDSIKSHPLKDLGNPLKAMNEEERAILQSLVDDSFTRFKEIVVSGRPKFKDQPEALTKVATGQVFTAQQALDHGLVDKIGFIEEAIDRAIELASLEDERDKKNVKVVRYKEQMGLMEQIMLGPNARAAAWPDLQALLTLSAPRAYYLSTWLPTIYATPH